jgi:hypothetical protein
MKRLVYIGLLFFVLSNISAKAQTKSVELPMKFRDGEPVVEVMINGKGPFLFAIDTGGQGEARADISLVGKLGLKKIGEAIVGDPSGKNNHINDVVAIESLKIGDLEFRNLEASTRDYNQRPGLKIDGILCFELFKNHLLTLDYSAKVVRIEEGNLPPANGKDILSFENPRGIPVVKLGVGNQTIDAHIDSGNANGGFVFPTERIEKLELASEPRVVGMARTVANTFEIKEAKLKDTIRFGSFEYPEPTIVYPAPSPKDANIGAKILRDYSLIFDQKNKRVKLEKKMWKEETPTQKLESSAFKDYVGQYGDRTISADNENLYIQRPNGQKLKMVALGKDEFTLEVVSSARIKFIRNEGGKVIEISVLNNSGAWETAKKN